MDVKKARSLVFTGLSGLLWTALDNLVVEVSGIEPLASTLRTSRSPN